VALVYRVLSVKIKLRAIIRVNSERKKNLACDYKMRVLSTAICVSWGSRC
jgi:hypothetical protein